MLPLTVQEFLFFFFFFFPSLMMLLILQRSLTSTWKSLWLLSLNTDGISVDQRLLARYLLTRWNASTLRHLCLCWSNIPQSGLKLSLQQKREFFLVSQNVPAAVTVGSDPTIPDWSQSFITMFYAHETHLLPVFSLQYLTFFCFTSLALQASASLVFAVSKSKRSV